MGDDDREMQARGGTWDYERAAAGAIALAHRSLELAAGGELDEARELGARFSIEVELLAHA